VSTKSDAERLKRAEAQLQRDHKPQPLRLKNARPRYEPGLCRADERDLTDAAKRRNGEATRADLLAALASITTELEFVRSRLGQVAPGDHRSLFREVEHGLQGLKRAL
jgi:2-keto-4-pentenoate hydratase